MYAPFEAPQSQLHQQRRPEEKDLPSGGALAGASKCLGGEFTKDVAFLGLALSAEL